jgi:hypothetical protein
MKTEARMKVPVLDDNGVYSSHRTVYVGLLRSDLDDPAEVARELEALSGAFTTGSGLFNDLSHLMEGGR